MTTPIPPAELPIPPVLILSTGRCGSTMISEVLNTHPRILSMSEFFVPLGAGAWAWQRPDGDRMWRTYSVQSAPLHSMLRDGIVVSEGLYPHDDPGSRFGAADLPPILGVTLPHLTDRYEELYDDLEPFVRGQPRQPLADHYRALFGYLARRLGRDVWIERSGGSLMHAAKLLRLFPEARVVHVYRDGRDTAISMSRHHNFRVLVGAMEKVRRFGLDPARGFRSSRGSRLDYWAESLLFRLLDVRSIAEADIPLTEFGAFWSRLIEVGEEVVGTLPRDRMLPLRFEDVQDTPREKLAELIRFIDPSLEDPRWLDQAAATVGPTRSSWMGLEPGERRALTEACAPGLQALGYPLEA